MSTRALNVAQAARLLKVSIDSVHKLCRAGKLPARKHSAGHWIIMQRDVTARIKTKAARNGAAR